MAKKKNNYYVVWTGVKPGIYNSWDECQKQIKGFTDAKYMGFVTLQEAEKAYDEGYENYYGKKGKPSAETIKSILGNKNNKALCVDAACSSAVGPVEYRGVLIPENIEVFKRGPFQQGTVNMGEFLAIVTGLTWLKKNKLDIPLYSDSRTAMSWVKKKKINTKLERTEQNKELFEKADLALKWLHNNEIENPIIKWETELWGEIPADFGRK